MKLFLRYFLVIIFCSIFIITHQNHAQAAWPLNTPEIQKNPHWAGENLVWNDNRLGGWDIFLQTANGQTQPLITSSGDQILLGASEQYLFYQEQSELLALNVYSSIITKIFDGNIENVSVYQDQVVWQSGEQTYWWQNGLLKSHVLLAENIHLSKFGLAWYGTNGLYLWNSNGIITLTSDSTLQITEIEGHIAYLATSSVHFYPNNISIISNVNFINSNRVALFYRQNGKSHAFFNGASSLIDPINISGEWLGLRSVSGYNGDLVINQINNPTIRLTNIQHETNSLTAAGLSTGYSIEAVATAKDGVNYNLNFPISNGVWNFQIDKNIIWPDGEYQVSIYAISIFGQQSTTLCLGMLELDRTSPILNQAVEISADLDSVKIHWHTDEKSAASIYLSSADETIHKNYNRFTFSHTQTISGLMPNTEYTIRIIGFDEFGNQFVYNFAFKTLSLLSQGVGVNNPKRGETGIWDGILLAEPGIIDPDIGLIMIDKPYQIEWTKGHPPPGLTRCSKIRIYGTVSSVRDTILLHGPGSVIQIEELECSGILNVENLNNIGQYINSWITISGTITHLTKSSWTISDGTNEIKTYWQNIPKGKWERGQAVRITGFLYLRSKNIVLAGTNITLLNDVLTKSNSLKLAESTSLYSQIKSNSEADPNNSTTKVVQTVDLSDDKLSYKWYNLALIGLAGVVYFTFFFHRH